MPSTDKKTKKKKYLIPPTIAVLIFTSLVFMVIAFFMTRPKKGEYRYELGVMEDSGKVPFGAIFVYDFSSISDVQVEIDFGDSKKKYVVPENKKEGQIIHMYQTPGTTHAKLVIDGVPVDSIKMMPYGDL